MTENNNPLLCDLENGICEIPNTNTTNDYQDITSKPKKPIQIIYFTDPICSSCWGIEPQLRKLKLEYGTAIEIEYRMGGLLPNWSYFNSGGIAKPSDVAHHWDEVSEYYDMPIDGDVWLEDPLHSSFPPSIAFKAAQLQDEAKAVQFMRRIREMVFLEKKNITNWTYLSVAANEVGLDSKRLKHDYENQAKDLFQEDLSLAQKLGVRGFPTLFFSDGSPLKAQTIYGFRPYEAFESAVLKVFPKATKYQYNTSWTYLFNKYPRLTTREFAELSGNTKPDSEILLQQLTAQGKLSRTDIKNGTIWTITQTPTALT